MSVTAPTAAGGIYNIACNQRYSLNQLVDYLAEIMGRRAYARYTDSRPGDVPHSQADISLARTHLGYEPDVDFITGLRHTVAAFQAQLVV